MNYQSKLARRFGLITAAAICVSPGLVISTASAEDRAAVQREVDDPVVPATREPDQLSTERQSIVIRRPGSVSDDVYAAEKAEARSARGPLGAVEVPIPPTQGARAAVTLNFQGLNRQTSANNGLVFIPPDTIVGKSPNRVIEATNSAIRLSNTAGGTLATRDLNSFFGAPVANGRLFDPKVYFDRNATNPRVYVVALQQTGRGNASLADNISRMWVAVSRSPDPVNLTTNWCRYNLDARGEIGSTNESWGDYPGIGAGRDSFSMTLNNFRFSDDSFRFARIHVWNKNVASNNAGSCPRVPRRVFQPSGTAGNFALFTIQPAQHYTSPGSAAGTTNPAYYLSTTRGSSNQYHVHRVRNVASGSPTYTRITLTGTSYGIPPDGNQPGTTALIDSGDNRVLQVAGIGNTIVGMLSTICNFSGGPSESCNLTPRVTVGIGGGGALTGSIVENTFAGFGAGIFVHHSSIATDTALRSAATWQFNGTGGGGFRHSSAAMIKSAGTGWTGVQTYAAGNCAYTLGRAGDYSGAQLDPALNAFWLAGEQALTISGSCQWGTRVIRMTP